MYDELHDGAPIGFVSGEFLLMALGNCSLVTLINHPLFGRISVNKITPLLGSSWKINPNRIFK